MLPFFNVSGFWIPRWLDVCIQTSQVKISSKKDDLYKGPPFLRLPLVLVSQAQCSCDTMAYWRSAQRGINASHDMLGFLTSLIWMDLVGQGFSIRRVWHGTRCDGSKLLIIAAYRESSVIRHESFVMICLDVLIGIVLYCVRERSFAIGHRLFLSFT